MPRPRKVSNATIMEAILRFTEQGVDFSSEILGEQVGVSRPTINRRLKEMDEKGWLRVKPYRDEFGHRRYAVKVLARGRKAANRATAA